MININDRLKPDEQKTTASVKLFLSKEHTAKTKTSH